MERDPPDGEDDLDEETEELINGGFPDPYEETTPITETPWMPPQISEPGSQPPPPGGGARVIWVIGKLVELFGR